MLSGCSNPGKDYWYLALKKPLRVRVSRVRVRNKVRVKVKARVR